MCSLCLKVSILHFTAHKISALDSSFTLLNVAVTYREEMKYMSLKSWNFSDIATFYKYLCLYALCNSRYNSSKQTRNTWWPNYLFVYNKVLN